jgi:CRP/FNR family cyclic AMP-dependent transcriptional regulator
MERRRYNGGEIIFKEGDPAGCAYKIIFGEVEIFKENQGQSVVLGVMKAGEFLGEMGLFDDQPRCASARAKTPVSMIMYKEDEFFHLISKDSKSFEQIIIRLCERLRTTSRKLVETIVSRKIVDTIEDPASGSSPHNFPANTDSNSKSTQLRLFILPLSKQLIPALPKEGVEVTKSPYFVGRVPSGEESKPITPVDLRIPDSRPFRLSREHFAIYQHQEGYGVQDLRSVLGTEVNGEVLGHDLVKDFESLKLGENEITAGGADSPFTFKVIVEST